MTFPVGTIVYLKSGSPPLTVTKFGHLEDAVEVEWFAGAEIKRDAFLADSLTAEKPSFESWSLHTAPFRDGELRPSTAEN